MRWKYYLMPAERPEVKSALELYALARSDALSAQAELSRLKAKGACMLTSSPPSRFARRVAGRAGIPAGLGRTA